MNANLMVIVALIVVVVGIGIGAWVVVKTPDSANLESQQSSLCGRYIHRNSIADCVCKRSVCRVPGRRRERDLRSDRSRRDANRWGNHWISLCDKKVTRGRATRSYCAQCHSAHCDRRNGVTLESAAGTQSLDADGGSFCSSCYQSYVGMPLSGLASRSRST
jgi:hypothetical protein